MASAYSDDVTATFDARAFSELVRTRRSIRDFRPDPIPTDVLEAILDDAKWAPSRSNTQAYMLAIASGERRDRISQAYLHCFDNALPRDGDFDDSRAYPEELQQYRRSTGFGLYECLGIERDDRAGRRRQTRRNYEFFGAPTAIFFFVHRDMPEFAAQDVGIMMQTLMLSAHARGLGTCAQGALSLWSGPVRSAFDVPEDYRLLTGMSIGYASDAIVNRFNPGRRSVPLID